MAVKQVVLCCLIILCCVQDTSVTVRMIVEAEEGREISAITCELDRTSCPLYWSIGDKIYDLHSLPEIFVVEDYNLRVLRAHRIMDGWSFYCFIIDDGNKLIQGRITELRVYYRKYGSYQ